MTCTVDSEGTLFYYQQVPRCGVRPTGMFSVVLDLSTDTIMYVIINLTYSIDITL